MSNPRKLAAALTVALLTSTALTADTTRERFSEEDRSWWAFRPVTEPQPPVAEDGGWARNPIDQFILERVRAQGLEPAPEADRVALVRRLYFDLIGLPPTPEQVRAFVEDFSSGAYERLVEDLLDSPHYGERWARHWLDLVRYADSDGYRIDHYRPNAWRYRDYVIRSLNADKPYDRFVREQIAGDELFPGDPDALTATGYLRHGIYEYNNRDARGQWDTILDDITDTTGDVFLGMGMQCARCHDHKFDPILQEDYFRLRAFFMPIRPRDDLVALTAPERERYERSLKQWEDATAEVREKIDQLEAKYRAKARRDAIDKFPEDIQSMMLKPAEERDPLEEQLAYLAGRQVDFEYERLDGRIKGDDKERLIELRKELATFDKLKPAAPPAVMAATDIGPVAPPTIIPGTRGTTTGPGFPSILDPEPAGVEPRPDSTGRRAALAEWMTRPDNPVTTRVIVNRVWQYHFGKGLAPNASDFGKLGGEPSHPELLDWLTVRFVRDGWSLKKLHRLIVTSATYRQSTAHPRLDDFQVIDPHNTLYWRADARRLDAEQIRDAILSATGQLKADAFGPGVNPDVPRRTIYTRVMRNSRDSLLDVFDLPQFFSSTSSRDTTTTPVQSLLLINSQQMLRHANALAQRAGFGDVERAWELAYGRPPSDEELAAARAFLSEQATRVASVDAVATTDKVLTGQVPYRNGQAIILNPDGPQKRLFVPDDQRLDVADFTVEAYFQIRSIYDTGSVRTLVSKWKGDSKSPGWAFGVTGKGSRRKPQTLVMQFHGKHLDGSFGETALFSDHHIELNKPYFAAVSVKLAEGDRPGSATFYLKDLSNDDEPLLTATLPHQINGGFGNDQPLTIGSRGVSNTGFFDGLVDDVRISRTGLGEDRLLYSSESPSAETVGHWQFEPDPGVFRDSSDNRLDCTPVGATAASKNDPARAAFVDLCHALLNSNEFLYVE